MYIINNINKYLQILNKHFPKQIASYASDTTPIPNSNTNSIKKASKKAKNIDMVNFNRKANKFKSPKKKLSYVRLRKSLE